MKILAIRGQNLASLARSFAIDLTGGPLAGVGLFVITGPVGAGKSTLLDALCLPLFDRTPRLPGRGGVLVGDDSVDDEGWLRSNDPRTLLRRDAVEGFAEVDFVGRDGQRYRAGWRVRRARRRVDGRVQEQELSLQDLDRGTTVASGRKTEVLAAIEQRLGLDFQQFCRSVLLAQGEFAAFLRASADERARLLENLTGADIYRRLSRAAHERRRGMQAEVDRLQAQVHAHVLLDDAARVRFSDQARQGTADLACHDLAVEIAQKYVSWYASAAQLRQQESEATVRLQAAISVRDAALPQRQHHSRLTMALPVVPHAKQVLERQRRLVDATQSERAAHGEVDRCEVALQRLRAMQQQATAALLGRDIAATPPCLADFARWQGGIERWSRALARARAAQTRLPELQLAAAERATALATMRERAAQAEHALQLAEERLASARAATVAAESVLQPAERRALAHERSEIVERMRRGQEWERWQQEFDRAQQQLAARHASIGLFAAALPTITARRSAAEQQMQELQQRVAALRVRVETAALLHHLVDGAPCPLCGSCDHPAPAHADDAPLRDAIVASERATATFDAAREAERTNAARRCEAERAEAETRVHVAACATALQVARQAFLAIVPDADGVSPVIAGQQLAAAAERLAARQAQLDAQELQLAGRREAEDKARGEERLTVDRLRTLQGALQQAAGSANAAGQAVAQAADELQRAAVEARERAMELGPAFLGVADWEARLEALGSAALPKLQQLAVGEQGIVEAAAHGATAAARFAKAGDSLATAREELRLAVSSFEDAMQQAGVTAVEVREAGELGAQALAAMGEELRVLDTAVERARAAVQACAQIRRQHEATGAPTIVQADASVALEDARTARQQVGQRLEVVRAQLAADDLLRRHRDELAPRLLAAEEAMRVWAALDDLIGSSHGDAFAVFAQGLTLDLLITEANRRLEELARRYRLQKNLGGELDFVVVDLDLGGTRRSLQTLSGGETFLVSLALALALATLAAPRSRVETLFLDEGFGTLDAHNLEQALSALDALQATGCQVGIISHVDGIAERIGAVVDVMPEGGGCSRVRVRV